MAKSDRTGAIQYGVLPYRINPVSGAEIMLLTSRGAGRWIIPKGWPMRGKQPHLTAATEAWEEAGITGVVSRKPIGAYHYSKEMADGEIRLCKCTVFLMRVTAEASDWPEQAQRSRAWLSKDQAAGLVDEGGLASLIQNFLVAPAKIRRHSGKF